jgi:hypothetical protein
MQPKDFLPYLAPVLIVLVIGLRLMRASKPRKIKPNTLWIGPLIVVLGMVAVFANPVMPNPLTSPYAIPIFAGALVLGGVTGFFRAKYQEFSIDPATGDVMSKASPIAMIVFLGVFAVRFGIRSWMSGGVSQDMTKLPGPGLILYTDAMLFFAFGMVAASAWEIWRRTRPLVLAHRGSAPES